MSIELEMGECLLGRYQVVDRLGEGGTASVYGAKDLKLMRDVAIKVIGPVQSLSWMMVQRFLREARAMASLDSPRVVPVYDVCEDGERYFMVMKRFDAPTLSHVLEREGPLGEGRALHISRGVLLGLSELHHRGIVHRDVKPSNLVLEEGDHTVLLDFGIAHDPAAPSLTQEGTVVGTPSYMAPEQILDPRAVDARTDLYALGVVLFEMFTGQLPFTGPSALSVATRHATEPVPNAKLLAPELSDKAAEIVARSMAKMPADRYASAEEMLEDIGEALRTVRRTPRFRWRQASLSAAGLALFAIALSTVSGSQDAGPEKLQIEVVAAEGEVPPEEPEPRSVVPPIEASVDPPRPPPKRRRARRPPPAMEPVFEAAGVPSAQVRRARAMLEAGDTKGALELLKRLCREAPDRAEPYATLGDVYAKTGNKVAAIAAYRRYLALAPSRDGRDRVEAALHRLGGR